MTWEEVCAHPSSQNLPFKIDTNEWGQAVAMSDPKYDASSIVISPEAEEAGRLYRQAITLAEGGDLAGAVVAAEAIHGIDFLLSQYFRNEALAFIAVKCADDIERALEIASMAELEDHRDWAIYCIAVRCAERGEGGTAMQVARRIAQAELRDRTLAEVRAKLGDGPSSGRQ